MKAKAKRFYTSVSVDPVEAGFGISLDGRALKTPGKLPLIAPQKHVANLIASEWDAQHDHIKPETMPITRLVNVSIELTPKNRDKLIGEARSYGETDLLCYRADNPEELVYRQDELWNPVLSWAASRSIHLVTTQSISAIEQPAQSLENIGHYAHKLDDLSLTFLLHLTSIYGSVILAMSVLEMHMSGVEAFNLSRLDTLFQIERWGVDEDAAKITTNLENEISNLCKILTEAPNG